MISLEVDRAVASAEAYFERGGFSSALEIYRAILVSRLQEPGLATTAFDAAVIERVADLATLFGQYSAAADLLMALSARFRAAGNQIGVDHALIKLCSVRLAQEQPQAARHALEQLSFVDGSLDLFDSAERADLDRWERTVAPEAASDDRVLLQSRFYLELSRLLAAHGYYRRAFAIGQRGMDIAERSSSPIVRNAIPPLTLASAAASLERGDLSTAENLLSDDATAGPLWQHPAWIVQRLEIIAKLRLLRGELGAAKAALDDVLVRCTRDGFVAAAAQAAMNLAHALILINQTKAAVDLLSDAERRAVAANDTAAAARAARLARIARLRAVSLADGVAIAPSISELWTGEPSDTAGSALAEDDPPEMPQALNFLTLFEDRALVFHWHLGRRDWDGARNSLRDVSETVAHTDSMLITGRLLAMECMLHYYAGDYAAAYEGLSETAQVFGDLGLLPDRWQTQRFLGWTLKRLGRLAEAEQTVAAADHTLDLLTSSLTDDDRATFRLNKWTADEEFLGDQLAALVRLVHSAAEAPWWRRFIVEWRLRKRMALFLSQIDRHQRVTFGQAIGAETARPQGTWNIAPASLRTARDTAVLGFLVLPDRVFVGRLFRRRAAVFVRPLTRLALRDLVSDWHTALVSGGPKQQSRDRMSRLSAAIEFERLLEDLPAGIRHLTIVADDSLRGVPFASLEYQGQPVAARFSVTTAFAWTAEAPAKTVRAAGLAVGVENGSGDLRPLKHTLAEIAMVDRWLTARRTPVTRLENENATCSAVAARLPGITHLHIASHGRFQRDRPDRSGLVLSGGVDDTLTLRDLAALDLTSLRIAVLSACWAADSFILPGRIVLSLPYTLWRSGARTVLAPLWEIDDAVALPFMTRFYELLESMSPRAALQQVQRECLDRRLPGCVATDTTDPTYWAGFQLYGDGCTAVA